MVNRDKSGQGAELILPEANADDYHTWLVIAVSYDIPLSARGRQSY